MATINITVQSLLNTAVYDSYTVDDAGTIGELKDSIETTTSCSIDWFDLVFDNEVLNTANTIASYGIVEDSKLRTHNKIARLANRELRQKAKLDLAALDRDASGNPRATYDITQLPTQYDGDDIVDNPNSDGEGGILLVEGRPWTDSPTPTYTFSDIPTSIDEGIAGTFDVATTNVDDGTTLYWTIATNAGDFETTSGSFTITSNTGSFTVTPTLDGTTESSETFTVSIRTGSISGTVVATSGSVTINDIAAVPLQVSLITAPSSGITWTDASTFGRNATLYKSGTGDHSYTASNGGGITTTGSTTSNGAMIDVPYNLPSTFTIEIVASITSTNYWSTLFGNEAYSFNRGYFMYFGSPTLVDIGSSTGSEMYTLASGQKANRNHYVVTVTGTTLKFYLNGSLQTKTSGTFAQPSSGISTNSLQIGARHPNAGTIHTVNDPAHGTYHRVQVWDVVKTDSEVTDLYTAAATAHNL
jgi:hypothetical protein